MIAEYAPGAIGTSSRRADLAKVVCADPDLLALEFDALMAATYPDLADRPDPRPPRRTVRLLTGRLPLTRPSLPVRREPPRVVDEQADEERAGARQRGPPVATQSADRAPRRRCCIGGDVLRTDRAGPVAPSAHARLHTCTSRRTADVPRHRRPRVPPPPGPRLRSPETATSTARDGAPPQRGPRSNTSGTGSRGVHKAQAVSAG
jgi:hypothetical protein